MRSFAGSFALAILVLAAPAVASERDATPSEHESVVQHLKKQGYTRISDVDVVNGRFEVDARSSQGADVDVIVDMKTLKVIGENPS